MKLYFQLLQFGKPV